MCTRRDPFFFAITENRGFIFRDDGIIITRSASYLRTRASERAVDFNDSFSSLKPASSRAFLRVLTRCHGSNPIPAFDQILPTHPDAGSLFLPALCDYGLLLSKRFTRTCVVQEASYLPLFLYTLGFRPILRAPSPLSSRFSFYPFVFAADEKIADGIGRAHVIFITCQSSHLSPGFQTVPALID